MPKTVSRREFVGAAIAGAVAVTVPTVSHSRSERPNILFILADDLGYGDLSCYGRPDYRTPNLDRLATQGVRFVNAYSASPLCTPTRCALITGRYPARTRVGLEEPLHEKRALGERALTVGLPSDHPTVASLVRQSGYETALIGKWHLGYLPRFGPLQSGFEEFFGCMSGAVDYLTHKDMEGDPDLFEGEIPVERVGYMTDLLTQRAVEYINRRKNSARPFYLSLHYTAPHWPWEQRGDQKANPELRGPVAFRGGGSLKTYAAMMKSLDDGIGKVLQALARAGLERNTLVVFTSDNGGERFSYHWPLTGQKNSLWEGGVRVPAIVRWPGLVSTRSIGNIIAEPAITMDWTATILAAAQAKPHPDYPLDGEDLLPRIRASSSRSPVSSTPRTFFWRNSNQNAALKSSWKYLNDGTREYLFNLSVDQREQANFREQNPAMFDLLRSDFKKWEAFVLPRLPPRASASLR